MTSASSTCQRSSVQEQVDARVERPRREHGDDERRELGRANGWFDERGGAAPLLLHAEVTFLRQLAHCMADRTVDEHHGQLAVAQHRREERLHERVTCAQQRVEMRLPGGVAHVEATGVLRAAPDRGLHDDGVPAPGVAYRVQRGGRPVEQDDRGHDRGAARFEIEQVRLVRVPLDQLGRIPQLRHRADARGPRNELVHGLDVVPRRAQQGQARAGPVDIRVAPVGDVDAHAALRRARRRGS